MAIIPPKPPRGRGAGFNPDNRYSDFSSTLEDDGWGVLDALSEEPGPRTTLGIDAARSVISFNRSPDVPFDRSINPYRGCEHGCVYCFARPTHAWLGLSPGLDFETRLFHKPDAPELLRKELTKPGYRCQPLALGINTDGWQPVERRNGLTRRLLEVLEEFGHPVAIVTKSALIERDIDILARMAERNLVQECCRSPPWTKTCAGAWNRARRGRNAGSKPSPACARPECQSGCWWPRSFLR